MRYLYGILACVLFGGGVFIGIRLAPRPRVSEVAQPTVTAEVERTFIKTPEGRTETRIVERKVMQPTVIAKVPPQYRLSALIPVNDYKDVTVGAARRLGGNVWLESEFNLKRKEVLVGVGYEF